MVPFVITLPGKILNQGAFLQISLPPPELRMRIINSFLTKLHIWGILSVHCLKILQAILLIGNLADLSPRASHSKVVSRYSTFLPNLEQE
jgi:hypothetical protein